MTVYVLKEDLKQLWRFRCEREARRFFGHWYARAMASGIAPVMRFAERLKPYLHGILAHCRWPLHTGLIEGINNRIKVIKRMAYGYRDQEYFFLKIRAAFPGVARCPFENPPVARATAFGRRFFAFGKTAPPSLPALRAHPLRGRG